MRVGEEDAHLARRGELLVGMVTNAMRALPTLGVLILAVMLVAPLIASRLAFVIPAIAVLVLLSSTLSEIMYAALDPRVRS